MTHSNGIPGFDPTLSPERGQLTVNPVTSEGECIAPVIVDGGTRFGWDVAPYLFEREPPENLHDQDAKTGAVIPYEFLALVRELRAPTTRLDDAQRRGYGGRSVALPMPEGPAVHAIASVSGTRREHATFMVPDVVYIAIGFETGTFKVEGKAKASWALGPEVLFGRWLAAAWWWTTGELRSLATLHDGGSGVRGTHVELCSDYTALSFGVIDPDSFVGFKAGEIFRQFERDGKVETINAGTRASPVSLCMYDKTQQIKIEKAGDDSTYAATWRAHGWTDERVQRVEFRLGGRALKTVNPENGEAFDLRDPIWLANRDLQTSLWSALCSDKRLVIRGACAKKRICPNDPKWDVVQAASGKPLNRGHRQTRETQGDTHEERRKRNIREATRSLARLLALLDAPDATLHDGLRWALDHLTDGERAALRDYAKVYRERCEEFMGPEIRTMGRDAWDAWVRDAPTREPGEDDLDQVGKTRRKL